MRLRDRTKFANYKRRGEWAELVFITVAQGLGFNVAKIWGDSAAYDVAIEMGGRFLRVQVKSCGRLTKGLYHCQLSASDHRLYTAEDIDYFACYVVPVDVWYIFPVQMVLGMQNSGANSTSQGTQVRAVYGGVVVFDAASLSSREADAGAERGAAGEFAGEADAEDCGAVGGVGTSVTSCDQRQIKVRVKGDGRGVRPT